MKTVNFYSCEVKCQGNVYHYSKEQLFAMAKTRIDHGIDCFDFSKKLADDLAEKLDGDVFIEFFPSNNIVRVNWAYMEDDTFTEE